MTAPEIWWSPTDPRLMWVKEAGGYGVVQHDPHVYAGGLDEAPPADAVRLALLPVAALFGIASQLDSIAQFQDRPGAMAEVESLAEQVRTLAAPVPDNTKETHDGH